MLIPRKRHGRSDDEPNVHAAIHSNRDDLRPFFAFASRRMAFTDPPQHTRLRARVTCRDNFNFRRLQALPVCFGRGAAGP